MLVFASLYPILSPDMPRIFEHHQAVTRGDKIKPLTGLGEIEFHLLPHEMRVSVRQLVASIHSLLQGMNEWEEIFTIRQTTHIIGTYLDVFSPARQRQKGLLGLFSLVVFLSINDIFCEEGQLRQKHKCIHYCFFICS